MVSLDRPSVEVPDRQTRFRPYATADAPWAVGLLEATGGRYRVRRNTLVDAASLPGIVAERDGHPSALLTMRRHNAEAHEFVAIASMPFDDDVVRLLLAAANNVLGAECRRVYSICSNAEFDLQRALQRAGFRMCAARPGSMSAVAARSSHRLVTEFGGLESRDELEFERLLTPR